MEHRAPEYLNGLRLGVPIVFGYVPVAIAFGLVSRDAGLPPHVALLFSALVFAGASQFMAVEMLMLGIDGLQIIAATLAVNFRHFLMSSSIASRVPEPVVAFGITDEVFAVASSHPGTLSPHGPGHRNDGLPRMDRRHPWRGACRRDTAAAAAAGARRDALRAVRESARAAARARPQRDGRGRGGRGDQARPRGYGVVPDRRGAPLRAR